MNISKAYPSKWLKAEDLEDEMTVTIKSVTLEEIGQGKDAESKPCLWVRELGKGLVLNKTNAGMLQKGLGVETDEWTGKKVLLRVESVAFGGDIVDAIRIHVPKSKTATKAPRPAAEEPPDQLEDDEIPGTVYLTLEERRELAAIAKDAGLGIEQARSAIGALGYPDTKRIPKSQFEEVKRALIAEISASVGPDNEIGI